MIRREGKNNSVRGEEKEGMKNSKKEEWKEERNNSEKKKRKERIKEVMSIWVMRGEGEGGK